MTALAPQPDCAHDATWFRASTAMAWLLAFGRVLGGCGTDTPAGKDGTDTGGAEDACKADTDCAARATACIDARCGKAGFCVLVDRVDGSACDDGDPCTVLDRCGEGVCAGKAGGCGCKGDADCAALDDDLCDGTLTCLVGVPEGSRCVPAGDEPVACPAPATACEIATCDPKTGTCANTAAADGTACDDGNDCTVDGVCKAGTCAGVSICPCQSDADCDDGNLCNGREICDPSAHVCKTQLATVVVCPTVDDTACAKSTCAPTTGTCALQPVSDGADCDDGDPCSSGEVCLGGACQAGKPICGCTVDADCAAKEDGNLCNGTLYCDLLASPPACKVHPLTQVNCGASDGDPCSSKVCKPSTGECEAVSAPLGTVCDDGKACIKGDACQDGACKPGLDSCPCKVDADCAAHDPNNPCVGKLDCDTSGAEPRCRINPATVPYCSSADDTDCQANLCDPTTGACKLTPRAEGATCDADGNPCTLGDVCKAGNCVAGANVCGCDADADCAAKDDANPCNGTLFYVKAAAPYTCKVKPGSVIDCPDLTLPCAEMACDSQSATCIAKPIVALQGKACDDGDACTKNTVCEESTCKGGSGVDCDDLNPCTIDVCNPATGCQNLPSSGAPCLSSGSEGACVAGKFEVP
ncbi:MAG: hypothetical protein RIT45_1257 [Pseudomonadota bacterium]